MSESAVYDLQEVLEKRKTDLENSLIEVNNALDALVAYPNVEALMNQFKSIYSL